MRSGKAMTQSVMGQQKQALTYDHTGFKQTQRLANFISN